MILVTTAGKVGAETARLLAERGQPVRLLSRDPGKVKALADGGVDVVQGDLSVPATIDEAVRGVSAVVLVSAANPVHEVNVIDSAARADVGHIVKITSKASADSPIARRRAQAEIERALLASGIPHTLLRNNAYMQNFLMQAPLIARTNGFATSTGGGRVGHVDSRDVAAVAAEIAASPAAHDGKTYWPTGPEALSDEQAAAVLSQVLGREIAWRPITFEQQRQAMIAAGLPEAVAEDNAKAFALFADGDADYVTQDVPELIGRPARSFETFVVDHAGAFS
jgi:uncharacterized protein YbjT (DUF2867 family)